MIAEIILKRNDGTVIYRTWVNAAGSLHWGTMYYPFVDLDGTKLYGFSYIGESYAPLSSGGSVREPGDDSNGVARSER